MAGKTNTTRIEDLEELTRNLVSRLNVHDETLKWFSDMLTKGTESADEHGKKIVVFEEKMLVLVDFKNCVAEVGKIREDLIGMKRDIESLGKWKDEQKKEKDETARRFWSFGPNIAAAIVSVLLSALVAFLVSRFSHP